VHAPTKAERMGGGHFQIFLEGETKARRGRVTPLLESWGDGSREEFERGPGDLGTWQPGEKEKELRLRTKRLSRPDFA